MTATYRTAPTNGPRFVTPDEIASIAEAARRFELIFDHDLMSIHQGTDATGNAFRITVGANGEGVLERLPILATDPRAWA